jgi:hypothetical protein
MPGIWTGLAASAGIVEMEMRTEVSMQARAIMVAAARLRWIWRRE